MFKTTLNLISKDVIYYESFGKCGDLNTTSLSKIKILLATEDLGY